VHDEGTQIVENIANIRVPMICAVEGKAWVHTEYCLLANVIVAGSGATFHDAPHFAGGIVPGDGIFTARSYRVGPTRAEAMLKAVGRKTLLDLDPRRSRASLTQTCRQRLGARSARRLEGVTLKRCAYHRENTLGAENPNSADTLDTVRAPSAK
jgi:hypothetical protein